MELSIRCATRADVSAIVQMLADDMLGARREVTGDSLPASYYEAFAAIESDPNNEILIATTGARVVASLQLTYTPSLSYRGSWRATIESVRTVSNLRGQGIGTVLVKHAIERARTRDCGSVQLTTHKLRVDARRFYERLGFAASHEGMKLGLAE